jgi:hypothetical protein
MDGGGGGGGVAVGVTVALWYIAVTTSDQVSGAVTHWVNSLQDCNIFAKQAKPLTQDEEDLIDRIDRTPDWIREHPDLADDVARKKRGEQLEPGKDHPEEARQWVRGLSNAIDHLELVRRFRDQEAQQAIDKAVKKARGYIDIINGILDP